MIVDFTVENFRSIKRPQTINLSVESNADRHRNNYSEFEEGRVKVLRSAVFLGANASGKSNFLTAVRALQWLVVTSGDRKEGQRIPPYEPFALDRGSTKRPVQFEVEFITPSKIRYRYQVSFNEKRILSESLYSYPKRYRTLIFERGEADTWETVKFGNSYKGGSRKIPFFPNNSYLSKAGNNAASPKMIREVYSYFRSIDYVVAGERVMALGFHKDEVAFRALSSIISSVDTGIESISAEDRDDPEEISIPDHIPDSLREAIEEQNRVTYSFWHKSEDDELVSFDKNDESDGTVRLFEMMPLVIGALLNGSTLIVDELDAHLHPHIIRSIVDLFHDNIANSNGGQIIFSSHNASIMSSEHMRREQILLTSKVNGQSTVSSLDEFDKSQVRPNSPFATFYDDGRLGAIPAIRFKEVCLTIEKLRKSRNHSEAGSHSRDSD